MAPTDRYVSESTFHVRYAETDMMKLVHHSAYIVWFEEGRSAFIREQGESYASIEASGYFLAVADLNARYIKAAVYDQLVTVKCWVESYKSRTITFACEVISPADDTLLFTATIKVVCINQEGQITRMPAEWKNWLDA